jgi:acyl-CoA dehydrogenase
LLGHTDELLADFRGLVRNFMASEVAPEFPKWEAQGFTPREFWSRAGELGILGIQVPAEFGGGGQQSFRFNIATLEESLRAGVFPGALRLHTDICMPYFLHYANDEQRQRWLPGLASGELIAAIGLTEAGGGSDLRGIRTRAIRTDGSYLVNGSKTYISNGGIADLVITLCKTKPGRDHDSMSLLVVERGMAGFTSGMRLDKIGLKSQDLSELFFDDVRVPASNLLGEEGQGLELLTTGLPQERLSIAANGLAAADVSLAQTVDFVKTREAFGRKVGEFQNTRFELATCSTEIAAGQAMIDAAVVAHDRGQLSAVEAAKAKLYCTELQGRVIDRCLQLHGGFGYMSESPVARAFLDARASRIFGGSSEIMKVIIAKSLGL